jgi:3-oxoacyl-[acyl-carrier protein] reductase
MVVGADLNAEKLEALATAKNGHLLPYVGSVADPEFAEATVTPQ